jgi:O-antigen ligase
MSLLWTNELNLKIGVQNFLHYTYWLCIPLIALRVPFDKVNNIILAYLLGMMVSEVISYGIYFELWNVGNTAGDNISPFMVYIEYSVLLAVLSFMLLERVLCRTYSLSLRIFYGMFFIATIGNLFLTKGRTGQFAFFVGLIVFVLCKYIVTIKNLILALALVCLVFVSAYSFSTTFQGRVTKTVNSVQTLVENGNYFTSLGQRVGAWPVTLEILKDSPLIGVGIGDYKDEFRQTIKDSFPAMIRGEETILNNAHLHNQYLMVLVQSGLVGFILMLVIMYYLYKLPISNVTVLRFKTVFIGIYFSASLAEPLWLKQFSMILFMTFVSLLIIYHLAEKQEGDLYPL